MKELWFIVAIMQGVGSDGKLDVFVMESVKFEYGFECKDFVREKQENVVETIIKNYNYAREIQKIICVPEQNLYHLIAPKT